MKTESVGIDSELLDTIRIYAEIEKKSNVEMVNDLLVDALCEYFIKRSGGAVFTLWNPQLSKNLNKKTVGEFVNILNETAAKIQELNTGIHFPIERIAAFYGYRLFLDSLDQKKQFAKNMIMDSDMSPKKSDDELV